MRGKRDLNFMFLNLQYCEILRIGRELDLLLDQDRNGVKDYVLTKAIIERSEIKGKFDELTNMIRAAGSKTPTEREIDE